MNTDRLSPRASRALVALLTLLFSAVFLWSGNRIAAAGGGALPPLTDDGFLRAEVVEILSSEEENGILELQFSAQLEGGEQVTAIQQANTASAVELPPVKPGDRITLYPNPDPATADSVPYRLDDYLRVDGVLVLVGVFLLGLILLGRGKGMRTVVSLALTCAAVFWVFLPLVLGGFNVYLAAIVVCLYVTVATLLLVGGPDRKTLVAMAGCIGGVLLSGLLTVVVSRLLHLTGMADQDAIYLADLTTRNPLDLEGIVFAGVLIGAVGAIMDVAMSLASALWELRCEAAAPTARLLARSGMTIGRDMMGTMANTLVLAYIGSSLSTVLLLVAYATSAEVLLNREMIATELLRAVVGSLAILITIPLTSLLAAWIYTRENRTKPAG